MVLAGCRSGTLVSASNFVSFSLSQCRCRWNRWNRVDLARVAGALCVHLDTVGVVVPPAGPLYGPSSRSRRRRMTLSWSRSSVWLRVQSASWSRMPTSPCRQSWRRLRSFQRSTSRSVCSSSMSNDSSVTLTHTGPLVSGCAKDGGNPAGAAQADQAGYHARPISADTVLRQGYCRRACCDAATDPSDADGFKDCESPEPVLPFQEEIDGTIKLFPAEHIPERNGDHIVDVPLPQTSGEVAEVVKAVNDTPLKHITEEMYEQIDSASHSMAQKVRRLERARKNAMLPNSSSRSNFLSKWRTSFWSSRHDGVCLNS